mmetsp:Transcript_10956/g.26882  ORF Transcript_10956/g.26882 Transcript_10956/m.26882 type:complete len:178 (+) Transcript_10956:694-1227(+)
MAKSPNRIPLGLARYGLFLLAILSITSKIFGVIGHIDIDISSSVRAISSGPSPKRKELPDERVRYRAIALGWFKVNIGCLFNGTDIRDFNSFCRAGSSATSLGEVYSCLVTIFSFWGVNWQARATVSRKWLLRILDVTFKGARSVNKNKSPEVTNEMLWCQKANITYQNTWFQERNR